VRETSRENETNREYRARERDKFRIVEMSLVGYGTD